MSELARVWKRGKNCIKMNNSKLFSLRQIHSHSNKLKKNRREKRGKKSSDCSLFSLRTKIHSEQRKMCTQWGEYANYIIFFENNLLKKTHTERVHHYKCKQNLYFWYYSTHKNKQWTQMLMERRQKIRCFSLWKKFGWLCSSRHKINEIRI